MIILWGSYFVDGKHILIIGASGTGKSVLIQKLIAKIKKKTVLIDGVEIYESYTNKKEERPLPTIEEMIGNFLIIDSLSLIERTGYWSAVKDIIDYRYTNGGRMILTFQTEAEYQSYGETIQKIASESRIIHLARESDSSKILADLTKEYYKSIITKSLYKIIFALSILSVLCLPFRKELLELLNGLLK